MQEETTQKTIALVFKSSRLTADVLKKAMKLYLEHRRAGKQATHGKSSVKELVGQGMGASSIEVTDNNIKSFERVAKKYNVDFAVKKAMVMVEKLLFTISLIRSPADFRLNSLMV